MGKSIIPKTASEYINTDVYREQLHCSLVRPLLECRFSDLWDDRWLVFLNYQVCTGRLLVCTYQRPSRRDDPGEPPVIHTTTFANPPYPKPRLFNKKLPMPLPGGKDVCTTKSKGAIFQKSSITSICYTRSGYTVNPLSYKRPLSNKPPPCNKSPLFRERKLISPLSIKPPPSSNYSSLVKDRLLSSHDCKTSCLLIRNAWPPTLYLGFSTLYSGYLWRTDIIVLSKIETPSLK